MVGLRKGLVRNHFEVTVPSLDDWEKEWGKIHNAACNQNCCRWISGRRWLPSPNRINTPNLREPINVAFIVLASTTLSDYERVQKTPTAL
jgi:hypothetical protein